MTYFSSTGRNKWIGDAFNCFSQWRADAVARGLRRLRIAPGNAFGITGNRPRNTTFSATTRKKELSKPSISHGHTLFLSVYYRPSDSVTTSRLNRCGNHNVGCILCFRSNGTIVSTDRKNDCSNSGPFIYMPTL